MVDKTLVRNRRRILLVDKNFQHRFVFQFWAFVVSGSVLFGVLVWALCERSVTTIFRDSRLAIMSTADFILPTLLFTSLVVILVVGTATAFIALFISHRIAGPVYRLNQDLAKLKDGDLAQSFHLRREDELQSLAASLNGAVQKIRGDVTILKENASCLRQAGAVPSQVEGAVQKILEVLDRYHV